jgi:hypothetical protein
MSPRGVLSPRDVDWAKLRPAGLVPFSDSEMTSVDPHPQGYRLHCDPGLGQFLDGLVDGPQLVGVDRHGPPPRMFPDIVILLARTLRETADHAQRL